LRQARAIGSDLALGPSIFESHEVRIPDEAQRLKITFNFPLTRNFILNLLQNALLLIIIQIYYHSNLEIYIKWLKR